ncbi:protein of unknown function (plasmid) [Caballeronia sp. S22]
MTSNLDFSEWGDAFPANRMLGAATLDRLRHGAYRIILDGDSYRVPKSMPELPVSGILKTDQELAFLTAFETAFPNPSKWRLYADRPRLHYADP